MSFLLRPSILSNHVAMLLLYFAGLFLIAPALAILLSLHDPEHVMTRLVVLGIWVQGLWIIAVSIELQHWQNRWTPRLIWAGICVAILASGLFPPEKSANTSSMFSLFWVHCAVVALAIQIACRLEKEGLGARALHSLLVLNWPIFLSLFANRLRADLEAAQIKRASQLS